MKKNPYILRVIILLLLIIGTLFYLLGIFGCSEPKLDNPLDPDSDIPPSLEIINPPETSEWLGKTVALTGTISDSRDRDILVQVFYVSPSIPDSLLLDSFGPLPDSIFVRYLPLPVNQPENSAYLVISAVDSFGNECVLTRGGKLDITEPNAPLFTVEPVSMLNEADLIILDQNSSGLIHFIAQDTAGAYAAEFVSGIASIEVEFGGIVNAYNTDSLDYSLDSTSITQSGVLFYRTKDLAGNFSITKALNILLRSMEPTIMLTCPIEGENFFLDIDSLKIEGYAYLSRTGFSLDTVFYWIEKNSEIIISEALPAQDSVNFNFNTGIALSSSTVWTAGNYILFSRVTADSSGNLISSDTSLINFTIEDQPYSGFINITYPVEGEYLTVLDTVIVVFFKENPSDSIYFHITDVDGVPILGQTIISENSLKFVPLSSNPYSIEGNIVTAAIYTASGDPVYDANGIAIGATRTFYYDDDVPEITIQSPTPDTIIAAAPLEITFNYLEQHPDSVGVSINGGTSWQYYPILPIGAGPANAGDWGYYSYQPKNSRIVAQTQTLGKVVLDSTGKVVLDSTYEDDLYNFKVKLRDKANRYSSVSDIPGVWYDTHAPEIVSIYPINNSVVNTTDPEIKVNFDLGTGTGIDSIDIEINGISRKNLAIITDSSLSVSVPLYANLSNTINFYLADLASFSADTVWTFKCDTTAPSVSMIEPPDSSIIEQSAVLITATVIENVGIDSVYVNRDGYYVLKLTQQNDTTWTGNLDFNSDTEADLQAVAVDLAGWSSSSQTTHILIDFQSPFVEFNDVLNEGKFNQDSILLNGKVYDYNLTSLILYESDALFHEVVDFDIVDSSWSYEWHPLNPAIYHFEIRATDTVNNVSSDTITLYWDNIPPNISITNLDNGTKLNADSIQNGSFTINGIISDNYILSDSLLVEVQIDNGSWIMVGNFNSGSNWSYTWSNIIEGTHTIKAKGSDFIGNFDTDQVVNIMVDTTKPNISISSPTNGDIFNSNNITITGVASDPGGFNQSLTILVDVGGGYIEAEYDSLDSTFSYDWTNIAEGIYDINARAIDFVENDSIYTVNDIIFDRTGPAIGPITPPNNTTLTQGDTDTVIVKYSDGLSGIDVNLIQFKVNGIDTPAIINSDSLTFELIAPEDTNIVNLMILLYDRAGNNNFASWNYNIIGGKSGNGWPDVFSSMKNREKETVEGFLNKKEQLNSNTNRGTR